MSRSTKLGRSVKFGRSPRLDRRTRASLAGAAAGLTLVAALTGCERGPDLAGSAAVVGDSKITDKVVTEQVKAVTGALQIEESNALNRIVIQRLINDDLVARLAEERGVVISNGDVDAFITDQAGQAGGRAQLEEYVLQRFGIPQSELQNWARFNLTVIALQEKLAPGLDPQQQQQVVGIAAIELADTLDTRVSPRFGSWDARRLAVQPPVDDLSSPPDGLAEPQLIPQ